MREYILWIMLGILLLVAVAPSVSPMELTSFNPVNNSYTSENITVSMMLSNVTQLQAVNYTFDSVLWNIMDLNLARYYGFNTAETNTTFSPDKSVWKQNMTIVATKAFQTTDPTRGLVLNMTNATGQVTIPSFNEGQYFTVDFWINPYLNFSGQTAYVAIISKQNNTCGFRLERGSSSYIWYWYNGSQRTVYTYTSGDTSLTMNNWTHLTITGNNGNVSVFQDGRLLTSKLFANYCQNTGALSLMSGFMGMVDEFKYFNRTLSYQEVSALHNFSLYDYNTTAWQFNATYTRLADGKHTYTVSGIDNGVQNKLDGQFTTPVCTNPIENQSITKDTILCGGAGYVRNFTGAGGDPNGVLHIDADNLVLDCNGTAFKGSNITSSRGLKVWNHNNVTITNCNVTGYDIGIEVGGANNTIYANNTLITNNIVENSRSWPIFIGTAYNYKQTYNNITLVEDEHCTYYSPQDNSSYSKYTSAEIAYNRMSYCAGQGIYVNTADRQEAKNILIHDNWINHTGTSGIQCDDCSDSQIYNNIVDYSTNDDIRFIADTPTGAPALTSTNASVYNNTLFCRGQTKCIMFSYTGRDIRIYGQDYRVSKATIYVRTNATRGYYYTPNFTIQENNTKIEIVYDPTYGGEYPNANITWNYTGYMYARVYGNNVTFMNLAAPNNDIKNISSNTILASDVVNYSLLVDAKYMIGDFSSPTIANVSVTLPNSANAIINWTTDVTSNSSIQYGINLSLTNTVGLDDAVTQHSITLTGLAKNTLYYYNITSIQNGSANAGIYSGNFTTADCTTPIENLNVNESMTLCNGTYQLNDSNTNGAIIINADNITLDGNGAYLIGNSTASSRGTSSSNRNNVTIKNLNIQNYGTPMYYYQGSSITIDSVNISGGMTSRNLRLSLINGGSVNNVRIENSTQYGIDLTDSTNGFIIQNSFIKNVSRGIMLEGTASNITIDNVAITQPSTRCIDIIGNWNTNITIQNSNLTYCKTNAIRTAYNISYINIKNNFIDNNTDSTSHLIDLNGFANYSVIYNNTVNHSGRNCIDFTGYYINVSYNTVDNCNHVGIDMLTDNGNLTEDGGYNNIFNNIVLSKGIEVSSQHNNNVYNNYVYGSPIAVEGNGSFCYGNAVYNNTINASNYSLYSGAIGTKWENNTIINSTSADIWENADYLITSQIENSSFINNYNPEGSLSFYTKSTYNNVSYTIDNSLYPLQRILITTYLNGTANFTKAKNIAITDNQINISNQLSQYPNNDVFNVSSASVLAGNVDNYSITLAPNQEVEVGDFTNLSNISFVSSSDVLGYFSRSFIEANVTVTGEGFSNFTLYLYNRTGLYTSNYSVINQSFINITGLPDGNYSYNATAYDIAGDKYNSTTIIGIIIDATNPSINFTGQTPLDAAIVTTGFTINVTSSDTNLNYTIIQLYDSSGNIVTTSLTGILTEGLSLVNGDYQYNATAYDLAGNKNTTDTRTVTMNAPIEVILSAGGSPPMANCGIGQEYINMTCIDITNNTAPIIELPANITGMTDSQKVIIILASVIIIGFLYTLLKK